MLIRIEQMTQIKVLISSLYILSKVKALNFICVIKNESLMALFCLLYNPRDLPTHFHISRYWRHPFSQSVMIKEYVKIYNSKL